MMPEVKPLGTEPVVASHVTKFLETDLLKISSIRTSRL
jgi:hypothetical protein